ncbi:MAG: RDD family protein, partial [Bdellovibrionales bacterium]|nr:RDD family protein [Bdellovibrionales bacterium]
LIVVMAFWIVKSATPGKMLFRMKIVDAENFQPVSPARLLVRYLAYFVSILPLFFGILWVVWDKKKQGWHDKIARTVVVRASGRRPLR